MIVHCDGSCWAKDRRMGVGIAFFQDEQYSPFREEAITIPGLGTSNEAEYHAIIQALIIILKYFNGRQEQIIINTDSQLIYTQIIGEARCMSKSLRPLLKEALRLLGVIKKPLILFNWVPRTDERQGIVDKLSKQANLYFQEKEKMKK